MMRNVRKLITAYQVAELAGTALTKAATPENVIAGFRVSGVRPFDTRHRQCNVDYLLHTYTPVHAHEDNHAFDIASTVGLPHSLSFSGGSIYTSLTANASTSFSTPETFRGYRKAGPDRHQPRAGKGEGQWWVATSTPEMAIAKKQHVGKMNANQDSSKAVTHKTTRAKATAKQIKSRGQLLHQENRTVTLLIILSAMNSVMARMVGNRQLCLETSLVSCFTSTLCVNSALRTLLRSASSTWLDFCERMHLATSKCRSCDDKVIRSQKSSLCLTQQTYTWSKEFR